MSGFSKVEMSGFGMAIMISHPKSGVYKDGENDINYEGLREIKSLRKT